MIDSEAYASKTVVKATYHNDYVFNNLEIRLDINLSDNTTGWLEKWYRSIDIQTLINKIIENTYQSVVVVRYDLLSLLVA